MKPALLLLTCALLATLAIPTGAADPLVPAPDLPLPEPIDDMVEVHPTAGIAICEHEQSNSTICQIIDDLICFPTGREGGYGPCGDLGTFGTQCGPPNMPPPTVPPGPIRLRWVYIVGIGIYCS